MKKSLLLFFLILSVLHVEGVEVFSRKLNTTNGLPDNNIRTLAQDDKGYIWMGSPTGLYRYDGYFFTTYKYADSGNLRLLNNNHVDACFALPDGRMLFREQGDLYSLFDTDRNQFVDMPQDQIAKLYQQQRRREAPEQLLAPYQKILAAGGNYINDNLGNVIVLDQTGQIWFIDHKTGETIRMKVYDERLFSVVSSQKYKVVTSERTGLIWVSTNGCGITVYDRQHHEVQYITQASGLLSTDYIQDICLDRNDNLWVADEFHGVVCLTTAHSLGKTYLLNRAGGGLRSNQVRIMYWTTDSLLMVANTQGDVYEADPLLQLRSAQQGMDIHCVATDREGRVWIGSRKQGLRRPDGVWLRRGKDGNTPSADNISALFCDRDGRLWIGCENARLDLINTNGTVSHFLPEKASPKVIVQDRTGIVWVGAKTGLYSFLPKDLIKNNKNYKHCLTSSDIGYSDVNCIYEDAGQCIWVGTSGDGLYCSEDGGETFRHITKADGLISDEIQSLTAVGDVLWIATTKGITRYRIGDGYCQYIYDEHNLQQNYYAENCVTMLPDSKLAFGTNQGIVVYEASPSHQMVGTGQSALAITDLLVNGESLGLMGNEVSLAHDQNTLTVHFSTFSFATSTRFTYYLDGYDKQWSDLSAYSFANYKNLLPGKYVLHVKAYDNNAQENAEQLLTIIIHHPWWQTWWAYLIYILIAAAIGFAVYRQLHTIYDLRRRISIEKELTEYKLVFFTNISHEFRTPLTIIRGAMDRIRNVGNVPSELKQPLSSMSRSADRMLRLINQLLEFRKMQNGKLRLALEDTDVVEFVKEIYQNFSDMADNKRIGYTFLPNVKSYMMPLDRQHMDKVVYNLLSNALKYTPSRGNVMVRLRIEDGRMTLRVEDTGVGIPKEKQAQLFQRFMQSSFSNDSIGIGLHLTKALVDVHHGTIRYEENQPQGSVFVVELPADRSAYAVSEFLQQSELESKPSIVSAEQPYQEMAGQPLNDRHVLIVEDDADVADYLKQLLGHYFLVEVAMDGASALDSLDQLIPDLVVSDVMMPVMNGFELLRRLRADERTATVPVILLTALNSDNTRLKGVENGADAYLTKPFDPKLLISTCRQLLEKHDKMRHAFSEKPAVKVIAPPEIIIEERDRHLLDVMNAWLYDHLSNPMLSVDELADSMGYGRSVFFKKVKALTGQTPAEYIRTLRMERAAEMLREETITVAEVCYKVGISDPHYFTKVFKQQFGISPKKYQQGK